MLLQGDKTQIDEFFRKDDNRVTITDQSSESVNIEMIEMRIKKCKIPNKKDSEKSLFEGAY
jgi:hypothetical protein